MKYLAAGLLLLTSFACNKSSKSDEAPQGPTPDAAVTDNGPLSGYTLTPDGAFGLRLVWNNPPASQTLANSAELYIVDADGKPVSESQLTRFHLYMASMGHPSIKENEMVLTQIDPGHWSISRIYFSMGGARGAWVLDVEATVQGRSEKVRMSVDYEVE